MRSLLALAVVAGFVSAGDIYTYHGSSEYYLGQAIEEPTEIPPLVPFGNYSNYTVFYENLNV